MKTTYVVPRRVAPLLIFDENATMYLERMLALEKRGQATALRWSRVTHEIALRMARASRCQSRKRVLRQSNRGTTASSVIRVYSERDVAVEEARVYSSCVRVLKCQSGECSFSGQAW